MNYVLIFNAWIPPDFNYFAYFENNVILYNCVLHKLFDNGNHGQFLNGTDNDNAYIDSYVKMVAVKITGPNPHVTITPVTYTSEKVNVRSIDLFVFRLE